jgi:hypothetical protein
MTGVFSLSETPLSTYLSTLLSGEAIEMVFYICPNKDFIVYTTSELSINFRVAEVVHYD